MSKLFIGAGTLLDCTGARPQKDKSIHIEDGRIVRIGDMSDHVPEGAKIYDCSDKTVMPGLMNAHVHIHDRYPYSDMSDPNAPELDIVERTLHCHRTLQAFLRSGVTYVRSMGAAQSLDIRIKGAMSKGLLDKIGLVTSGPSIVMTGGHGYESGLEVNGADACRQAARTILKNGADMLKVMATGGILSAGSEVGRPQLSYEELRAVVEEAHNAGKKVAAHAQGPTGIRNAVTAGVDSIEHGCIMSDGILAMMQERGTYLVPTLCAVHMILENKDKGCIPENSVEKAQSVQQRHAMWVKRAYDAGVPIAAGTDSSTPFNPPEMTWYEIKLLKECGVPAMEAILAATKNCAQLLGVQKTHGTVEEGKTADLIVLDDNPLEKLDTLANVRMVFKEGVEVHL